MRIKWIDGTELCVEPPAPQEDRLLSQNAILEAMNAWDWQELYLPIHFKQLLEEVPPAQPEQQHGRVYKGIVVEYPSYNAYPEYKGKPYFSIKYTENGQEFIGYGTYNPEVLSEWLKEYFMPPAQPEIVMCKDCKHNPKDTWFECPLAHLSEKQRPETAWCWKGEKKSE